MSAPHRPAPQRIQLRRAKGWRKPEGAVVVARPTKWGNPIRWRDYYKTRHDIDGESYLPHPADCRRWAVTDFRDALLWSHRFPLRYPSIAEIRAELAGKDLACWCPLDEPCHADVLLELANGSRELVATGVVTVCCEIHLPAGCCDPNDCGPCCPGCPTCPTLQRERATR